jgi:hypothetical protein
MTSETNKQPMDRAPETVTGGVAQKANVVPGTLGEAVDSTSHGTQGLSPATATPPSGAGDAPPDFDARVVLIKLFRAFEAGRVPQHLPGCPEVLGYDDMADWFLARIAASPSEREVVGENENHPAIIREASGRLRFAKPAPAPSEPYTASPVLAPDRLRAIIDETEREVHGLLDACFARAKTVTDEEKARASTEWRDMVLYATNARIGAAQASLPSPSESTREALDTLRRRFASLESDHDEGDEVVCDTKTREEMGHCICGSDDYNAAIKSVLAQFDDWRAKLAAPPVRDAEPDREREEIPTALRPLLHVGETEAGEWGLWCLPPNLPSDLDERIPYLYGREPQDDVEMKRADSGDANWGPSVGEMWAEFTRAARSRGPGGEGAK